MFAKKKGYNYLFASRRELTSFVQLNVVEERERE